MRIIMNVNREGNFNAALRRKVRHFHEDGDAFLNYMDIFVTCQYPLTFYYGT